MPQPLMDRMEIIRIPGYTEDEKVEIAFRHLVPKQMKDHALKKTEWTVSEDAVRDLVRYYTREAGVRNLEREIANLARKSIKEILMKNLKKVSISRRNLAKFAGVRKFRYGEAEAKDMVGVVTGLAWTEVGGEILVTEATLMPGKGHLTLTGKLGDVMQESAQAALSYVRSRAAELNLAEDFHSKLDIHVHVPEGAIPKDGPSAGITMATTLVSALTKIPARRDVAMTGEITLRGKVLPIGGVKEKVLAAHRAGVTNIVLPRDNEKDLADIPKNVLDALNLHLVSTMDEVLKIALAGPLPARMPAAPVVAEVAEPGDTRTH
jgi:ATP-dependent Lon protease